MDFRTAQMTEIEIAARPFPEYETCLSLVFHKIVEPEPFYFLRRLIPFTYASRKNVGLVELPVLHHPTDMAVPFRWHQRLSVHIDYIYHLTRPPCLV